MTNDQKVSFRLANAWWERFRNQRLTVRQIILTALEGGDATAELRAVLSEVAPSVYRGAYSPQKLGRWLVRHGERYILNDDLSPTYVFVNRGADRGQVWQLQLVEELDDVLLPEGFLSAVA